MGALMLFHMINFKQGTLLLNPDSEPLYASIKLEEFHYFSTEEVNAHSLADESSYIKEEEMEEN